MPRPSSATERRAVGLSGPALAALAAFLAFGPPLALPASTRAADGDAETAGWSAAWRVLLCARSPSRCEGADRAGVEAAVLASLDEAPVVLRAQALLRRDPAALDRASVADPRSPWDPWLRARIGPNTGRVTP